jgi:C1A family cysteine protease
MSKTTTFDGLFKTIAAQTKHRYAWIPDTPDGRDHLFLAPHAANELVNVDLRKTAKVTPVVDQGQLGSCTANSIASALGFDLLNNHDLTAAEFAELSRLFIYYNERALEKTINQDAGAQIRDGIKVVAKFGAPYETDWPYNIAKFKQKPPAKAYTDGLKFKALEYERIDNTDIGALVSSLAMGLPFAFGFSVYSSFESSAVAKNGVVPMPNLKKEQLLGGHAVCAYGYDVAKKWFIVENSWGTSWGDKGFFYIPAAYITNPNMADDFWNIKSIQ